MTSIISKKPFDPYNLQGLKRWAYSMRISNLFTFNVIEKA
jgi:hypothetical protein